MRLDEHVMGFEVCLVTLDAKGNVLCKAQTDIFENDVYRPVAVRMRRQIGYDLWLFAGLP